MHFGTQSKSVLIAGFVALSGCAGAEVGSTEWDVYEAVLPLPPPRLAGVPTPLFSRGTVLPEDGVPTQGLRAYLDEVGWEVPDQLLDSLESANPETINDENQLYTVALVLTMLGDSAAAEQYLDKALSLGFSQAMIDATPELGSGLTQNN